MSEEITINGKIYVEKNSLSTTKGKALKGMRHVIVRTYSAGVFAGYLQSKKGAEVVLRQARRLWYWKGANSLSDLAVEGTKAPTECKFPVAVDKIELLGVIEIIETTKKAQDSIATVKVWSA